MESVPQMNSPPLRKTSNVRIEAVLEQTKGKSHRKTERMFRASYMWKLIIVKRFKCIVYSVSIDTRLHQNTTCTTVFVGTRYIVQLGYT